MIEVLFNQKPDYFAFKVFRCLCYPCVKPYNNNKIKPYSTPCDESILFPSSWNSTYPWLIMLQSLTHTFYKITSQSHIQSIKYSAFFFNGFIDIPFQTSITSTNIHHMQIRAKVWISKPKTYNVKIDKYNFFESLSIKQVLKYSL